MDRVDFLKYNDCPVSSETYDFLQSMILLAGSLAKLGGMTFILSGCTETLTTVSAGTVVINGEVLPFDGGVKSAKVIVTEAPSSVQADGNTFTDIYFKRSVGFGSGVGEIDWASFKRVNTLQDLTQMINDHLDWHKTIGAVVFGGVLYSVASAIGTGLPYSSVYKLGGSINVISSGGGTHCVLTHNLGHTKYVVRTDAGVVSNIDVNSFSIELPADYVSLLPNPNHFTITSFA